MLLVPHPYPCSSTIYTACQTNFQQPARESPYLRAFSDHHILLCPCAVGWSSGNECLLQQPYTTLLEVGWYWGLLSGLSSGYSHCWLFLHYLISPLLDSCFLISCHKKVTCSRTFIVGYASVKTHITTICALGFSRETEPIWYIESYIRGHLLWKLAHVIIEVEIHHSMPSASWRTRKVRWYNLVWVWRPESQRLQGLSAKEDGCPNSKIENLCFLCFLFQSDPQRIRWCPPILGRVIVFTQSTDSNANLFCKHTHRNTQK